MPGSSAPTSTSPSGGSPPWAPRSARSTNATTIRRSRRRSPTRSTRRGLAVRRQVGCSGFRIDLALVDPKRPGRFLLGIECDGATYHSSATARDRDRLRQEVLESLGWSIVRIWSTDWVKNPNAQVERVVVALEQARKAPPKAAPSQSRSVPKVRRADEAPVKIIPVVKRPGEPESKYQYDKIDEVPDDHHREARPRPARLLRGDGGG